MPTSPPRLKRILRTVSVACSLSLLLGACLHKSADSQSGNAEDKSGSPQPHRESVFGSPSTEFSQRPTIEDFEATVLRAYERFIDEMVEASHSSPILTEQSRLKSYEDGAVFDLPIVKIDANIPCDQVIEAGDKHFRPVGLSTFKRRDVDGRCELSWLDPENGSIVFVDNGQWFAASGESSARPITDSSRVGKNYQPSEWERALAK